MRACDVRAVKVLDQVFLTDPMDTYYAARREHGTIVSLACHEPDETCFCKNFDVDAAEPGADVETWFVGDTLYWKSLTEKGETLTAFVKEALKSKAAKDALGDVMDQVKEINGVKVLAAKLEGVDMNGLRDLGDQLKEKLGEGVVVLASAVDGKVSLMATATDGAQKKGAHAGNLIKAIAGLVGGGGGGRPGMAQAGGKNADGIDAAIAKAAEVAAEQIK